MYHRAFLLLALLGVSSSASAEHVFRVFAHGVKSGLVVPSESMPSSTWKALNLGRTNWYGAAYGAGTFVLLADSGMTVSIDGKQWTKFQPAGQNWGRSPWYQSLIYADGRFLGVGYNGVSPALSTNGLTWEFPSMPTGSWISLAYGQGKYVSVNGNNSPTTAYSIDGRTWVTRAASFPWSTVAFGNGIFVAVPGTATNVYATSVDGVNWTQRTLPRSMYGRVTFANNHFYRFWGGLMFSSTDGLEWTASTVPITFGAEAHVAYGGGRYMAVTQDKAMTSLDGLNWTAVPMPAGTWSGLAYGNGRFVASSHSGYEIAFTD